MFELIQQQGDHYIYNYNTRLFDFKGFLEKLYGYNIYDLLDIANDYYRLGVNKPIEDIETDLHKKFYKYIKENDDFKHIYCSFIQEIYKYFFPTEQFIIYQSFPSIRLQYPNNIAVPPHCDSDNIGCHPNGEKNFLIPITKMENTTTLYIEKTPGSDEYISFNMDYGNILYFNGNKCIHYNKKNEENYVRVSFDFRVITSSDYCKYIINHNITTTNPRDPDKHRHPITMIAGGYYQIIEKMIEIEEMKKWYINKDTIVQSRPLFETEEKQAICKYMTEGDPFITEFQYTSLFESKFCELTNTKYAYMVPSGTAALLIALYACDIKPGDSVIVPNYTMVATVNAIKGIGAIPIIIDVNSETYTLDIDIIKKYVNKQVKAIIHASINNYHYNLSEIVSFCKKNNIYLIEDAAQSVGQLYKGKHIGTFGDIGCYSFSTPKIISTGQGGAVVTNSFELSNKIKKIKNFGRRESGIEEYDSFGLNFKVTDIHAILGIEQLKKIPNRRLRLRQMYNLYYSYLNKYMKKPLDNDWFPWFITIEIENRKGLQNFLMKHKIQTRISYPQIDATLHTPNAKHISEKGLYLPTHFLLTDDDIKYISRLVLLYLSFTQ